MNAKKSDKVHIGFLIVAGIAVAVAPTYGHPVIAAVAVCAVCAALDVLVDKLL